MAAQRGWPFDAERFRAKMLTMAAEPGWRFNKGLRTVGRSMRSGHRTLNDALEALAHKPESTGYTLDLFERAWEVARMTPPARFQVHTDDPAVHQDAHDDRLKEPGVSVR